MQDRNKSFSYRLLSYHIHRNPILVYPIMPPYLAYPMQPRSNQSASFDPNLLDFNVSN